jgi:hypothetical protein
MNERRESQGPSNLPPQEPIIDEAMVSPERLAQLRAQLENYQEKLARWEVSLGTENFFDNTFVVTTILKSAILKASIEAGRVLREKELGFVLTKLFKRYGLNERPDRGEIMREFNDQAEVIEDYIRTGEENAKEGGLPPVSEEGIGGSSK